MSKNPLIQQSLVDKIVAFVAPKYAQQRMTERANLGVGGGYTGARIDRAALSRWITTAGSANADIIRDLPTLRARSRDQMRNAPLALGAINTTVSHVVGTGLALTPSPSRALLGMTEDQASEWAENTKLLFDIWAESTDCDLARRLNFYGLQDLAFRSVLESGDIFVITPKVARDGAPEKLVLQLVEADRACNPNRAADTQTVIDGIEINPDTGETIAVHFARQHPGDIQMTTNTWERRLVRGEKTGRRNVLHIFKPLRPGQVRGVPLIAPILEPLKQLAAWTDNELNAAVTSSLFSVFVKMDPDAFDDLFDEDAQEAIVENAGRWSGKMESGQAVNLLPGESIETSSPGRPNPEFDPFWSAIVRQIGMALDLPFEVLTMHFQSSYSAARAALLMAWKTFRTRRDMLATYLCQPAYELWLADEVASGRISAPGFFSSPVVRAAWCKAIWTGDGPGSIDPVKEVDAAQKRVDMGISTKDSESILHDGIGWRAKHGQRVKEINAEKRDGIYLPPMGRAPVAPETPPADAAPGAAADE